jgi:hypothetical protein
MNNQLFENFGKLLMERVRVQAISGWDMDINGLTKDARGKQIKSFVDSLSQEQKDVLRHLGPRLVDGLLHDLLFMLEEYDWIHLSLESEHELIRDIRDVAAGELQGYAFIWAEEYSKERLSYP